MYIKRKHLRRIILEYINEKDNTQTGNEDNTGFSVRAKYIEPHGNEFYISFKSKDGSKLGRSKNYKSEKVESAVKLLAGQSAKYVFFQLSGMKADNFKQFMPRDYSPGKAHALATKIGIAVRKAVEKGRPKPEDGSTDGGKSGKPSIVKRIEQALGMQNADDKWTEKETDAAWHKWVDANKGELEKLYPGKVPTLRKSWSQFAKQTKDKGVKGGPSGMLTFINKKGKVGKDDKSQEKPEEKSQEKPEEKANKVKAEAPENRATLYRRRYRRY